jgi:hypothetical protein
MLLASNKQHKEIPKTERQNTQKRTVGKNKDQLHYMHTQFMWPYIPFQTPLTGQKRWGHWSCWPQLIFTQQLYSILFFFGTISSKFSKAWQKQIYHISMKLPSHTTALRIKNPPNFISIRIKTFFQRYDYTYCCNFQICVCPKQTPMRFNSLPLTT